MGAIEADERVGYEPVSEPTPASMWFGVSGGLITDELLEWPPDLFALTNVVLVRAEAFRFAVAPADEWPPSRYRDWPHAVEEAGRGWSAWIEDRTGAIPDLVAEEWSVVRERAETPLEHLASGRDVRDVRGAADVACDRRRSLRRTRHRPRHHGRHRVRLPRARPRTAGQNRIAGSRGPPLLARTAESPHAPDRAAGVLTLRLRARSWHRGSLAQDPGSPPRDGPSVRVRHAAAVALAAEGASVRLSPYRRLRAEADERPVWILRVRAGRKP